MNPIDLGNDFYLVKFTSLDNYNKALKHGPWFIGPQYLLVRQWEPKFNPHEAKLLLVTIWIRLQDLPTEFYNITILKRIGQMLGTLLKIDNCMAQASRGRYARLCILTTIGQTMPKSVLLGTHLQKIHNEDKNPLCTLCGCLGHKHYQYTTNMGIKMTTPTNDENTQPGMSEGP